MASYDNAKDQEDELISICRHTLSQVDDIYTNGHIQVAGLDVVDRCLWSKSYIVYDSC